MNHSLYSADRRTHLKTVVVGILCACFVLIVGVFADVGQLDLVTKLGIELYAQHHIGKLDDDKD